MDKLFEFNIIKETILQVVYQLTTLLLACSKIYYDFKVDTLMLDFHLLLQYSWIYESYDYVICKHVLCIFLHIFLVFKENRKSKKWKKAHKSSVSLLQWFKCFQFFQFFNISVVSESFAKKIRVFWSISKNFGVFSTISHTFFMRILCTLSGFNIKTVIYAKYRAVTLLEYLYCFKWLKWFNHFKCEIWLAGSFGCKQQQKMVWNIMWKSIFNMHQYAKRSWLLKTMSGTFTDNFFLKKLGISLLRIKRQMSINFPFRRNLGI